MVQRHFDILPLVEATERLRDGCLPRRTACITFDDGYADNLTVALPILERYHAPATVFIATAYLDGGRMFNDTIIEAVRSTPHGAIDLTELGLGRLPLFGDEAKRVAIDAILNRVKYSPPAMRDQQVARIVELLGCDALPADVMLTSAQVRDLAEKGIEIGGHTVNHSILNSLDDASVFQELRDGKESLEAIIGRTVTSFAYPNGRPGRDFSPRHIPLVKLAGFSRAVTTGAGICRHDSDSFQLPRFTPWGRTEWRASLQLVRNARQSD